MSCSGNCNSCSSTCTTPEKKEQYAQTNQFSKVKKVIGVVSGKGGVGKSLVTSYLAVLMNRKGYQTAILDGDITGPSIPKTFGITKKAMGSELGIIPAVSEQGTKIISVNLLLDSEEMPVLWRGPIIGGTVKQFWSDVIWEEVDYMFVDMPPGTGDVPLTVFQSIPVDGIIIVTSPQELVSMIVAKAVNMAKAMNVPILGMIENYSYIQCGNCGEKISVFGESHADEIAKKYNLQLLDRIPIDPKVASAIDKGEVEKLQVDYLDNAASYIENSLKIESTLDSASEQIIAVPLDDKGHINQHFGKSKRFCIYNIKDNTLQKKDIIQIEEEGHVAAVTELLKNKVMVVLCGGIGQEAIESLANNKVKVCLGLQGESDIVVATYLDGGIV